MKKRKAKAKKPDFYGTAIDIDELAKCVEDEARQEELEQLARDIFIAVISSNFHSNGEFFDYENAFVGAEKFLAYRDKRRKEKK